MPWVSITNQIQQRQASEYTILTGGCSSSACTPRYAPDGIVINERFVWMVSRVGSPGGSPRHRIQRQALLQQITTVPRWAPPGWAPGGRTYWLAQGPVGAVYHLARSIYKSESNFWWPDDQAWLSTDIDFDCTLIGTYEERARRLLPFLIGRYTRSVRTGSESRSTDAVPER